MTRTIVADYDGTITEEDLLQRISRIWGDVETVEEVEAALREGRITLRDEITREYRPVKASLEEVQTWVLENVRIRAGFRELVELSRERGWQFLVLSSGFEELIRPTLEREGVDVEIVANRVDTLPTGWVVHWRDEALCAECGEACKRAALPGEGEIVYIGDGISDRCAALAADRIFAIKGLAAYLEQKGVPFEPFADFHDVARALA